MKLAIMSDLHNEFDRRGRRNDLIAPPAGHPQTGPDLRALKGKADVLLLAGDTDIGREAVRYGAAAAKYLDLPVVMIAGNHEYYDGIYGEVLNDLCAAADKRTKVHFLENRSAELDFADARLRVLGGTLWTDYALDGDDRLAVEQAMRAAADGMTDHWIIRQDGDGRLFTPQEALKLHQHSRGWLEAKLAETFDGITVVMTHHGVSARSQPPRFKGSALGACFTSNLDELVAQSRVPLWVHGHTHYSVDYMIGDTRVVAHQRGYPGEAGQFEPLIIEL